MKKIISLSKNKIFLMFAIASVFMLSAITVYALGVWDEGYKSENDGVTMEIYHGDADGTVQVANSCHTVTNDHASNDYFIPTKTTGEWDAFASNLPSGVSVGSCGNVCVADDYYDWSGTCSSFCAGMGGSADGVGVIVSDDCEEDPIMPSCINSYNFFWSDEGTDYEECYKDWDVCEVTYDMDFLWYAIRITMCRCSCPPVCTSHDHQVCYDNDVYWYDSCGAVEDKKEECGANGCSGGSCVTCSSHSSYSCYNNDVYWYDSCGAKEDKKQECGTSGYTGSDYCYDNDVYKNYVTKGCSGNSCTSSTVKIKQEECGASGCSGGSCVLGTGTWILDDIYCMGCDCADSGCVGPAMWDDCYLDGMFYEHCPITYLSEPCIIGQSLIRWECRSCAGPQTAVDASYICK